VLAAWLKDAGIDYRIEFLPWARALQSSRTQPNSLLFTAARTPEREPMYEWIGPFAPRRTVLMGLRSGPHPATLDASRSLRIGVINGDAGMEYLKSQGFVVGQNLVPVSQRNDLVRLLAVKGIDLIAANPIMLRAVAAQAGQATADIENVMTLVDEPRGGFYFAVNKQSNAALLRKLHAAFQHLRDSGQLAALQARHHIN
jgi:polar amino acid transport system substrate-binding protein